MITIDVGNSNWGVGVWAGGDVDVSVFGALDDVLAHLARHDGPLVAISVAPRRLAALRAALPRDVDQLVEPAVPLDPPTLARTAGADRLAAATALLPGPAIAVDAGTAVTLDVVDGQGVYRGGYIAPGPAICARALGTYAEQLPLVPGARVELTPGGDTTTAIGRGVWGLCVGGVDRLVDELRAVHGPAPVVATGGWGRDWLADTRVDDASFDGALVHRGIRAWAARRG